MGFIAGALVHTVCFQAMYWCAGVLFGEFQVSDNIKTDLVWYGNGWNGIFTNYSIGMLSVYSVASLLYLTFRRWKVARLASTQADLLIELDTQEAQWKEEYLRRASDRQNEEMREGRDCPKEEDVLGNQNVTAAVELRSAAIVEIAPPGLQETIAPEGPQSAVTDGIASPDLRVGATKLDACSAG